MIRKFVLLSAVAISSCIASYAQGNYDFPVDKYDFGVIEEGTIAAHEFEFTNSGQDSLNLKKENIRPSCGCTTPKVTEGKIAPGAKGTIAAEFNSMGRVGTFNKTINIFEENNIIKTLTIRGVVIKKEEAPKLTEAQLKKSAKISSDKKEHGFGKIEKGSMVTVKFNLKNQGKDTLKITSGQSACNCINFKLMSGKDNAVTTYIMPGKTAVLELTYNPTGAGKNRDIITLFTNDPVNPRFAFTLTADVVETIIEQSPVKQGTGSPFQK